jgi:hypothetical protein
MAYETKCVRIACPYQQSSNAGLLSWCCQLMCMWLFFMSFCVSWSHVLDWKCWVGRCACTYICVEKCCVLVSRLLDTHSSLMECRNLKLIPDTLLRYVAPM